MSDDDVRALASEMNKPALPFDPCTLRKGEVVAVNATTVDITLSGSDVVIPDVAFADSYSPVAGDTVNVLVQSNAILVMGQPMTTGGSTGAGGWTAPAMGAGFTGSASGRGALEYRRILDNGAPKIQWRGACVRSSGTGTVVASGVPAAGATRTVLAPRDPTGGSNSIVLNFNTDGTVSISGDTTSAAASTAVNQNATAVNQNTTADNNNSTITIQSGGTGIFTQLNDVAIPAGSPSTNYNHRHEIATGHTHGNDSHDHSQNPHTHTQDPHTHTQNAHTHAVNMTAGAGTWVSFDGIEYFI